MSRTIAKDAYARVRAYLRDNGTTRRTARAIGQEAGVSERSVYNALDRLRDEGLIEERWEGSKKRVVIWKEPSSDRQAETSSTVRVLVNAC